MALTTYNIHVSNLNTDQTEILKIDADSPEEAQDLVPSNYHVIMIDGGDSPESSLKKRKSGEKRMKTDRLTYERTLLNDATVVMESMREQIEKMRGMFDDEDGAISMACHEHDEIALRIREYFANIPTDGFTKSREEKEEVITNKKRGIRANHTLFFYQKRVLKVGGPIGSDLIVDFVTDLKHYCHQRGYDFHEILAMANTNFVAEVNEEAGEANG